MNIGCLWPSQKKKKIDLVYSSCYNSLPKENEKKNA